MPTTSSPRFASTVIRLEPIKPAAPVTRIFIGVLYRFAVTLSSTFAAAAHRLRVSLAMRSSSIVTPGKTIETVCMMAVYIYSFTKKSTYPRTKHL